MLFISSDKSFLFTPTYEICCLFLFTYCSLFSFFSLILNPPHVTPTLMNTIWCICVTGESTTAS